MYALLELKSKPYVLAYTYKTLYPFITAHYFHSCKPLPLATPPTISGRFQLLIPCSWGVTWG